MSEEKVKLILGIKSLDEAVDAYEEALFEVKNWLKSKPLLRLTAKKQIGRLLELKTIEHYFIDNQQAIRYEVKELNPIFEMSIHEWWLAFQEFQINWYKIVFDTDSAAELLKIIEVYFEQKVLFCSEIKLESITDGEVVFGVESDWMVLERGFKQLKDLGVQSFSEIETKKDVLELNFLLELKRLSLLPKYLKN